MSGQERKNTVLGLPEERDGMLFSSLGVVRQAAMPVFALEKTGGGGGGIWSKREIDANVETRGK